jgi:cytoskeletal protein CcmA (bactofilin family)
MRLKKRSAADEILSILGEGAEIAGEVTFASGLRINGVVKGKIKAEAILEIGPNGKVDAEANVRKILINGEFRGIIQASDRVEIHKEGKVFGDIYSPCLIIEAGGIFEGRCNMIDAIKSADLGVGNMTQNPDSSSATPSELNPGQPKN